MNPSLKQRLITYLRGLIPVEYQQPFSPRAQPASTISGMTVDRLAMVIDGATAGDTRDLFALYRDIVQADSHLQMELGKRKLALLGDPFSVRPLDKKNANDVAAAVKVKAMIDACPAFRVACAHLLDATLWPVSVVEKVYRPMDGGYMLSRLIPVDPQLLDFITGALRIRDTDPDGYAMGSTQIPDPYRYIVHRGHLLGAPDAWGGPMRSIVFWWLLGAMSREWWAQFLDRYGTPFLVGKYPTADKTSRSVLERAFSLSTKLGGLVVSTETEVEIKQAAVHDSGEAYEKFLQLCNKEKSKLILGQTLSSGERRGGLGSSAGEGKNEEEVRQDIRQFDGVMLAETLQDQLVRQWQQFNGVPGRCTLFWGGESPSAAAATGTLLAAVYSAGLEPADDALPVLSERLGFNVVRQIAPAPAPLPKAGERPVGLSLATGTSRALQADAAGDEIARAAAAPLARAFRGNFAALQRIILESQSADECAERAGAYLVGYRPGATTDIVAAALEAYTANGAAVHAAP